MSSPCANTVTLPSVRHPHICIQAAHVKFVAQTSATPSIALEKTPPPSGYQHGFIHAAPYYAPVPPGFNHTLSTAPGYRLFDITASLPISSLPAMARYIARHSLHTWSAHP